YSENTRKGFKAVGVCLDEKTPAAELAVDFIKNKAKISLTIENNSRTLKTVDLDPERERGSENLNGALIVES
ncbi:MAG: hypothetical protein LBI10_06635, partial [Deltaproteobacteria bacterium]|nr:hypothetical protein [Deltaproteobacteria bacterium]